jgi:hypothetical protein
MVSNRLDDVQVEVLVDDTWWPGWLDPSTWRQVDGRWRAFVRWQTAPAENHLGTFDQDQIKQVN